MYSRKVLFFTLILSCVLSIRLCPASYDNENHPMEIDSGHSNASLNRNTRENPEEQVTSSLLDDEEDASGSDQEESDVLEYALLHAILDNDYPEVQQLIEDGVNVDFVYDGGMTPLMEASLRAGKEIRSLIKDKAEGLSESEQDYIVHISKTQAFLRHDKERAEFIKGLLTPRPSRKQKMLDRVAAKKRPHSRENKATRTKRFVYLTQCQLLNAIGHRDCNRAKDILARLQDFHNTQNELYYIFKTPQRIWYKKKSLWVTPLQFAASLQDEKMLAVLLDAGPPTSALQELPSSYNEFLKKNSYRLSRAKKQLRISFYEREKRAALLAKKRFGETMKRASEIVQTYAVYRSTGSIEAPPYCAERVALALHALKTYANHDLHNKFPAIPKLS